MEGVEPEELVEVSVVDEEEAPTPEESVLSGSEAESAPLQPEAHGRHRVVTEWCLQQDTDAFNSALKILFLFCLGATLLSLHYLDLNLIPGQQSTPPRFVHPRTWEQFGSEPGWRSGVFPCYIIIGFALCAALFALCVDVKRRGLKCKPVPKWIVQLSVWTRDNLKEVMTSTKLHLEKNYLNRAVLQSHARHIVDWLKS